MLIGRRDKKKSLASRCRHYLDFQSKAEVSDGEGGFTEVWSNIAGASQIPAEVLPLSADRRAELRSWNVIATHEINVRSYIPVAEVGRAVFSTPAGTRYFYIHTVEDLQTRSIEQIMIAEERRP
jgi:hypothetical protein